MKTTAKILIKYSASKCNKDLLDFLHENIYDIKNEYTVSVVIVYDDLIPKLGGNIKRLPVLITKNNNITGNEDIKKFLTKQNRKTITRAPVRKSTGDDLDDFWNNEMHSKGDNETDDNDLMSDVKNRALEQTVKSKEETVKSKGRKSDNIKTENTAGDNISDIADDDPVMRKYWENQESTPGFG